MLEKKYEIATRATRSVGELLKQKFGTIHFFCLFLMLFLPAVAVAQEWDPLIDRLAADGFSEKWLQPLFNQSQLQFNPSVMAVKMKTLYKSKFGDPAVRELQRRLAKLGYKPGNADGKTGAKTRKAIRWFQAAHGLTVDGRFSDQLLSMALKERNPAPTNIQIPSPKPGPLVYRSIMTEERLSEARAFMTANQKKLLHLERYYGVPSEIAVGILTVETRLGTYVGEESAFQTLASMALCDDFKCVADAFKDEHLTKTKRRWLERRIQQKARWAYGECKALLTYAVRSGRDPLTIPAPYTVPSVLPSSCPPKPFVTARMEMATAWSICSFWTMPFSAWAITSCQTAGVEACGAGGNSAGPSTITITAPSM